MGGTYFKWGGRAPLPPPAGDNPDAKRIKPLLKREVNNETFFTSLRSYCQISLVYVVYILLFS